MSGMEKTSMPMITRMVTEETMPGMMSFTVECDAGLGSSAVRGTLGYKGRRWAWGFPQGMGSPPATAGPGLMENGAPFRS